MGPEMWVWKLWSPEAVKTIENCIDFALTLGQILAIDLPLSHLILSSISNLHLVWSWAGRTEGVTGGNVARTEPGLVGHSSPLHPSL